MYPTNVEEAPADRSSLSTHPDQALVRACRSSTVFQASRPVLAGRFHRRSTLRRGAIFIPCPSVMPRLSG